ncbi:MAG: hypothetical protein Q9180_007067 [Flavoplaca navasiana]
MMNSLLKAVSVAWFGFSLVSAIPRSADHGLVARQGIDFNLLDSTPDPTVLPDDRSHFNQDAAIASVVAAINASPLPQPQKKRSLDTRDVVVSTYPGYTANVQLANASMSSPVDYNNRRLQSPKSSKERACLACQFYNTYAMDKNGVYQGQYCLVNVHNQPPPPSLFKHHEFHNFHLCPYQNAARPDSHPAGREGRRERLRFTREKNLTKVAVEGFSPGVSTRTYFPAIAGELNETTLDYFMENNRENSHYFIEVGDHGYEAVNWWN